MAVIAAQDLVRALVEGDAPRDRESIPFNRIQNRQAARFDARGPGVRAPRFARSVAAMKATQQSRGRET